MNRILILFILIALSIGAFVYLNPAKGPAQNEIIQFQNQKAVLPFEYSNDDSVTILKFKPELNIKLLINNSAELTSEAFAKKSNCIGMINAGYFLSDYSHAGLLKLNGELQTNLARLDTQLTHIVSLDTIQFDISAALFDVKIDQSNTLFQTGPLMIKSNVIQTDLINNSINGEGNYLRSVLGYTNENEIFFVITKLPTALDALSQKILNSELLQNKNINAINLDGGSSVSLFTSEKKAQYGIAKKLPYYLCITE